MKKIIILTVLCLPVICSYSQEHRFKVGVSGGIAFPVGLFGSNSFSLQKATYDFSLSIPGFPFPVPVTATGLVDGLNGGNAKRGSMFSVDVSYIIKKHFGIAGMYRFATHAFNEDAYKPNLNINVSVPFAGNVPASYVFPTSTGSKPWVFHSLMFGPNYEYPFWKGFFDLRLLAGASYFKSFEFTGVSTGGQTIEIPSANMIGFSALAGLSYSFPVYKWPRNKTAKENETSLLRDKPEKKAAEAAPKHQIYVRLGAEYFYASATQNRSHNISGIGLGTLVTIPGTVFQEVNYKIGTYGFNLGVVYPF